VSTEVRFKVANVYSTHTNIIESRY
jgi:hypothetical protein